MDVNSKRSWQRGAKLVLLRRRDVFGKKARANVVFDFSVALVGPLRSYLARLGYPVYVSDDVSTWSAMQIGGVRLYAPLSVNYSITNFAAKLDTLKAGHKNFVKDIKETFARALGADVLHPIENRRFNYATSLHVEASDFALSSVIVSRVMAHVRNITLQWWIGDRDPFSGQIHATAELDDYGKLTQPQRKGRFIFSSPWSIAFNVVREPAISHVLTQDAWRSAILLAAEGVRPDLAIGFFLDAVRYFQVEDDRMVVLSLALMFETAEGKVRRVNGESELTSLKHILRNSYLITTDE